MGMAVTLASNRPVLALLKWYLIYVLMIVHLRIYNAMIFWFYVTVKILLNFLMLEHLKTPIISDNFYSNCNDY